MPITRTTARAIDAAAAVWAARMDRGLSTDEQAKLDGWLAEDSRHLGAYGRALAVSLHSNRVRGVWPSALERDAPPVTRLALRRRDLILGAGSAGVAASIVAGVISFVVVQGRYATRRGEMRVTTLSDGSMVALNTDTTIRVTFSRHQRSIHLLSGEALFDVAKDRRRPFVVTAGDAEVRAVGTSFSVQHLAGAPVRVLVREGVVDVKGHAGGAVQSMRIGANNRASVTQTVIEADPVSQNEVRRRLSWKEGFLSFEGETLDQAASEYERYSPVKIVIEDPELGSREIVGLFSSSDPVGFAQAVASAFNAKAEVGVGEVRIRR